MLIGFNIFAAKLSFWSPNFVQKKHAFFRRFVSSGLNTNNLSLNLLVHKPV